jgi:DNA-binding XRE family transcriptional regulator
VSPSSSAVPPQCLGCGRRPLRVAGPQGATGEGAFCRLYTPPLANFDPSRRSPYTNLVNACGTETEAVRPDDKAEIARRFRKLRRGALMTQLRLGQVIGIGRQAVSSIENKRTLPRDRTWVRFAILEGKLLADRAAPSGLWQ